MSENSYGENPIEIITIGNVSIIDVEQAISIANSTQNEFSFSALSQVDAQAFKLLEYKNAIAQDFLNVIESQRVQIRGYHPFLIVLEQIANVVMV